jgi:PAS domain S-box-containing protein
MNPSPNVADSPARILIVDDERHDRQLLEVMLTQEGFLLLTAAGGEEALAIVAQQPPDLILLDITMPGMDGYQVAGRIKGDLATKNIPVIMVTGLEDRNARILALSTGAEDFLTKPVDRAELCARVRNLLRLKAYGDYYDRYSQMLEGEVGSRTADLVERAKILEQQAAVLADQAALLDLAQDAIIVRDMRDRILFWSRGAEVMYGWLSKEALGRNKTELLRTEFSEPADSIDATLLGQGQWEGEAIHHKRNGTRVFVASRWALQRDADGVPIRVLTINNDITRRKQADSELLQLTERLSLATAVAKVGAEAARVASEAKSNFLATMSHEIRTPMNGIIGMTELALDTDLTEEAREHLGMVKTSAVALLGIINDILDFSKIEAGKLDLEPVEFDLRDSIGATLKALVFRAHAKGLEVVCRVDAAVPQVVIGDDRRLRQILTNLVGNAIKFAEQGDISVHVGTEAESARDGVVVLHFAVSDTGIGIPEHRRDAIFNSFEQADSSTTRKYGGTGLGLAISANLARVMGGRMWVESEVGRGSTFHFTIQFGTAATALEPAVTQSEPPAAIIALEQPGPSNGARPPGTPVPMTKRRLSILLAEDNAINQRLAVRLLEKRGHHVVVVASGGEAVAATANGRFDAVLMDVQMPDMDGLKATAAIRARESTNGHHVPIIAMTANALKGDRERCLAAGMDAYLSKPIQRAVLFTVLEELVAAEVDDGTPTAAPAIGARKAGASGPIDTAALREFADGDEDLVREFTDLFLETSHDLLTAVRDAIARGDARALEHAAHSIRGAASVLVARDACERAQRLELMGRANDLAGAHPLCAELEREIARVEAALRGLEQDAPTSA